MNSVISSERVRANKFALLFFSTIAISIGIAPATFVIGQVELMIILTISTLIGVLTHLRSFESFATEKPSFLDYIIASIGIFKWGVITSFSLLFFYLISRGVIFLIELIANAFGSGIQFPAHTISYWVSVIITFIFNLLWVNIGTETFAQQLYPEKTQRKSVLSKKVTYRRRSLVKYLLFALVGFLGIVLVVWYTTGSVVVWNIWWFNILFLFFLFYLSIRPPYPQQPVEITLPLAIKAVHALFESLDYQVIVSPKTGKPEYDPFMAGLNFFVQNEENALAVIVQTKNSLWIPSSFRHAIMALEDFFEEEQKGIEKIVPVVFLIGQKGEKEIGDFKVVQIREATMNKILDFYAQNDQKQLKKYARRYLKKILEKETRK